MKLSLGKLELLQILSDHFGVKVEDVTIVKNGGKTLADRITRELTKKIGCDPGIVCTQNVSQKIPAIKMLRDIMGTTNSPGLSPNGMGLADAKWAIENWAEWIAFVAKYNRVPNIHTPPYYGAKATLS